MNLVKVLNCTHHTQKTKHQELHCEHVEDKTPASKGPWHCTFLFMYSSSPPKVPVLPRPKQDALEQKKLTSGFLELKFKKANHFEMNINF